MLVAFREHPTLCILMSENMSEYGGIQKFAFDLSNFATAKGFKIALISSKDAGSLVSTRFLDATCSLERRNLANDKTETKLLNTPFKSLLLFVSTAFALIRVCKNRKVSVIHAQDAFFSGFAGVVARKLFKIPLIIHVHGPSPYFVEFDSEATQLQKCVMRALAKVVLREATLILPTDIHTKSLLLPFSHKVTYLCMPTPIITKVYADKSKKGFVSKVIGDTLVLGFIGRLCKQKNLRVLLNAFASVPMHSRMKLSLIIVGDGPERNFLEHEAMRVGIRDNVLFTGNVSEDKKLELLELFDVFILPSIYEGCPISLLEAMASGKAIIASNIPSIKQIVRQNQEAILVDPYNVEELRDAIMRFSNNPQLISEIGRCSFQRAKLYDVSRIFTRLMTIYETVNKVHQRDSLDNSTNDYCLLLQSLSLIADTEKSQEHGQIHVY